MKGKVGLVKGERFFWVLDAQVRGGVTVQESSERC